MKTLKVGDRVQFSSLWLRNTGQYFGDICFVRGHILHISPHAPELATVFWDSFDPYYRPTSDQWVSATTKVLLTNLQPVKGE